MAKKRLNFLNKQQLGILLIAALIIQHVLPSIKLGQFSWIATIIYLGVALYLFLS